MPVISQLGQLNTAALTVADLYVQIVPPQFLLNGVPSNIVGLVGTATWGPVGVPTIVGGWADGVVKFGTMQPRKYDVMTALWAALLQGASVFRIVRVTDGTDVAATASVQTNCLTITSKYTGSLGNQTTITVGPGSAAGSWRIVVAMPGVVPEVFDNLTGTGAALWANAANAINLGQSGLRGPSQMIVATAGAGTTAPVNASYTLTGGADGATPSAIAASNAAAMVGSDAIPRRGMYALRSSDVSVGVLVDVDDSTTWTTQAAFGLAEGIYMVATGPAGDTISNAVSTKAAAGVDSYALKLMLGDWIYFGDTVNFQQRLISPQGFVAGVLGNLAPNQSSLNKELLGVVGTQKSQTQMPYTPADLDVLARAGIDVICNPVPGGSYFGCRNGRNTSSNASVHGDNYTRLTNFIAKTVASGMGIYVGQLQTPDERRRAKTTLDVFLSNLQAQGLIGTADGSDCFQVVLDNSNNPAGMVALGYQQAYVKVVYLSVVEFFLINLEGGQTVTVTTASAQPLLS